MKRRIAGPRAITEALKAKPSALAVVYVAQDAGKSLAALCDLANARKVRVESRPRSALDQLADTDRHQGAVAIAGDYPYLNVEDLIAHAEPGALLVALDEITDPHNFGAIVRSAVALGAAGVITLKQRAAPVTGVVVRSSAGATEHARIARVTNLAQTLKTLSNDGFDIVGLASEGSEPLENLTPADRGRVLVVGSEGKGLRRLVRERCDKLVSIALPGPIESLNASVAAGLAIHHCMRL